MKRIYVLGSLNMDLVIESDRAPVEGETITGHNFRTCPGGKGLNQAIAAAKLGADVRFLGAVGKDSFGREMKDALKKNGVNIDNILDIEGVSSGIAVIQLIKGDNRITLDLGANLKISKADVDKFLSDASSGDIFLTQLECNFDAIGYALEKAKKVGMTTILNPAPANIEIAKYLRFVDIFTPNETEFALFSKDKSLNIDNLIITLGGDGYRFVSKNESFEGSAIKVKVVDTTGAGDTFNGALAYQLAKNGKITKAALDFACKAASISVTRLGSSVSSPTLDEVMSY